MARKKKKKGNTVLIVVGILFLTILIVLGALYFAGYKFFTTHFYPQTTINGKSVSLGEADVAIEKIREEAEDYLIAIHDREDRITYINGDEFDYHYEEEGTITGIMAGQEPLGWIMNIAKSHDYEVPVKMVYDQEKLKAVIKKMPCFKKKNIVKPQDAYMAYTENGFEIIPEVEGSKPLKEQIFADVFAAVEERQEILKLDEDDYAAPAIRADDPSLQEKMAVVDRYRNMSITYEIEGYEEVLTGETILSWITFDEKLNVTVDPDKAANYAQYLASTYNTFADTRSFKTTGHGTINIGGGDYGWIVAKTAEAQQLIADITAGESVKREPCWEQRAYVGGTDDIGNTYIELDYTGQHLYYYQNGQLVLDSDIVSGRMSNGNGSPDGVFKVISRQRDYTLVGEDYESKVDYFLPFAYNVGFHDAYWIPSFGGSYYKNSGSHGCINLPYDVAENLYNTVELGTPVIAYYREAVTLKSEHARISNAYSYSN